MTNSINQAKEIDEFNHTANKCFEHDAHPIDLLQCIQIELLVDIPYLPLDNRQQQDNEVDPLGEADHDQPGSEIDDAEEKRSICTFWLAEVEVSEVTVQ